MNADAIYALLREHEAVRLRPYRDTAGKLTIGVGRNLDDIGISLIEANYLLQHDVDRAVAGLDRELPWWRQLDEIRQRVLVDMAFNLGLTRLLEFKRFLSAMERARWADAVVEMKRSDWWHQVGPRAERLAHMVETGEEVAKWW